MKRLNLNSILVVGNGSVATNEYGFYRYFVDNRVYYHRQALVIVADETPTVCCGSLTHLKALNERGFWDVRMVGDRLAEGLVDILGSRGITNGRIGYCPETLPASWFDCIHSAYPELEWVDCTMDLYEIRKKRSREECRLVEKCAELALSGYEALFRNAFLYDIAPQLGTRCSYRLDGEYVITPNDFAFPQEHEDVIAWHSTISFINDNCPIEIPYRAILPKKTENLLCPGRHISADEIGIDYVNLIPQCVGTGQAAGVAAAVAIADGTTAHKVNIKKVQDILARDQDVPLPRNPYTDPSYMQNVVDHEYGLYTQLAKNAREKAGYLSGVRQFGANQGEIVDSDSKSIKGGGDAQLNPDLIKATPQH